jgi:hypothetical protein
MTDPKAHLSLFRLAFIRPLEFPLDLDRTVNRIEHADEFREYAIPGSVRNPPTMPPDQLVD